MIISAIRRILKGIGSSTRREKGNGDGSPTKTHSTILVIDDEEIVAEAIQAALSKDYKVRYATSGKDALEFLMTGETFDLIISDVTLLDMSVQDVYDSIKTTRPGLEENIIFLTGGAYTKDSQDFLARVSNMVLEKPITLSTLRVIVQNALSEKAQSTPVSNKQAA